MKLRWLGNHAIETLSLDIELPGSGAELDVEEIKAPKRLGMGDLLMHVADVAVAELVKSFRRG